MALIPLFRSILSFEGQTSSSESTTSGSKLSLCSERNQTVFDIASRSCTLVKPAVVMTVLNIPANALLVAKLVVLTLKIMNSSQEKRYVES